MLQAGWEDGDGEGFLAKGNAPRCNLIFSPNVVIDPAGFTVNYTMTDYFGANAGSGSSSLIHDSDLISVMDTSGTKTLYRYFPLFSFGPNTYSNLFSPPSRVVPPYTTSQLQTGWFHMKVSLKQASPPPNALENAMIWNSAFTITRRTHFRNTPTSSIRGRRLCPTPLPAIPALPACWGCAP